MSFQRHQFDTLQKRLSKLGFNQWPLVTLEEVQKGVVFPFGLFLRFIFSDAYPTSSAYLMKRHNWFVVEAQDKALVEVAFKVLDTEFGFKPAISVSQFLKEGHYAGHKVDAVLNLLTFMSRLCQSVILNKPEIVETANTTGSGSTLSSTILTVGTTVKAPVAEGGASGKENQIHDAASFSTGVRTEQELRVLAENERQRRRLQQHPQQEQQSRHPHYLNETSCSVASSSCSRVSRGTSCVSERQKEVQEQQQAIRRKLEQLHNKHRQLNRQPREPPTPTSAGGPDSSCQTCNMSSVVLHQQNATNIHNMNSRQPTSSQHAETGMSRSPGAQSDLPSPAFAHSTLL